MGLVEHPAGGYAFLPGSAPYSSGVVALAGFELVRATLQRPLPYREGFAVIDRHLAALERPAQALCAIELRSPRPWSMDGFDAFNAGYRTLLEARAILLDGVNPIARTNVAPVFAPPGEPVLYAFSYSVPADAAPRTFVNAGSGELDGTRIIAEGDTSAAGRRTKARYVMAVMAQRLAGLGCQADDITALQLYCAHAPLDYLADTVLAPLGVAAVHAFHWCYSLPPVIGLEFEADMRGIRHELRLPA
jgi:hypothetical protein